MVVSGPYVFESCRDEDGWEDVEADGDDVNGDVDSFCGEGGGSSTISHGSAGDDTTLGMSCGDENGTEDCDIPGREDGSDSANEDRRDVAVVALLLLLLLVVVVVVVDWTLMLLRSSCSGTAIGSLVDSSSCCAL